MTEVIYELAELARPARPNPSGATTAMDEERTSILLNRVSWGAILAGVVVALTTQVLLTMLGAGIGVAISSLTLFNGAGC